MAQILPYQTAIQYDGTNSAEIAAAVGGNFTVVNESGGVLSVTSCGNSHTINTGDWVRYDAVDQNCVIQVYQSTEFTSRYILADDLRA